MFYIQMRHVNPYGRTALFQPFQKNPGDLGIGIDIVCPDDIADLTIAWHAMGEIRTGGSQKQITQCAVQFPFRFIEMGPQPAQYGRISSRASSTLRSSAGPL